MRTYYGTKRLQARPMTRGEYVAYRGWQLPADENPADAGYLVEYEPDGKPNDPRHAGYISWSPKHAFDEAYQLTDEMDFSHALKAMKDGHRVQNQDWNGVGMWVALGSGSDVEAKAFWNPHSRRWAEQLEKLGQRAHVSDYFLMKTGKGEIQMGWAPDPKDILGTRWRIVPEEQP